ncbi:hypothetical protein SAMN04488042_1168 [Shimia aestuarii]|uniref:Uncharacterized protein n=2 Tax=Shimia aestuarii TaxID=254406 RepID=A0A1I4TEZ8_9RHOB|nr:hypothetical protein SAMN04488042_1168 [Shimia aestuarii]
MFGSWMIRSPRQEANRHNAQPNMLVRAISGMSVSIRAKLLVAFLGVTFLMAGLAVVGLATLRQANDRTEKLIRDQERIAYFNEAYSYLSNLLALAAAIPTDPVDVKGDNVSAVFVTPGFTFSGRVQQSGTAHWTWVAEVWTAGDGR